MTFAFNQLIALPILNFVLYGQTRVEGRPKEVVPAPGWFNNVEGFILQNPESSLSTEPSYMTKTKDIESDETMNSVIKRKLNKKKKKKKKVKKAVKRSQDEEDGRSNERKITKKKKKRKPKERLLKFIGSDNKFIKSDNKAIENKDSNLSDSQEKRAQGKPVDIIVHIKMNE